MTNIAESDVEQAPLFEDIGAKVLDMLQDHIFVAHNIHFDLPFLQKELKRVGLPKPSMQNNGYSRIYKANVSEPL